jgi:hypothetical protein
MSVTKRINGNYTITTAPTWDANVTISTHTVYIDGNLQVGGNTQSVTQTNTDITDNIITLNKGETGPGVSVNYSGIQVDRGTGQFLPVLRWSEPDQRWQITNDGSTYQSIVASTGGSFNVVDDTSPQLGGELDVQNFTIFSATSNYVAIDGNLALSTQTVAPPAVAQNNVIYSFAPGGGGTGVYQKSLTTADELVSRNRALVFSLVL